MDWTAFLGSFIQLEINVFTFLFQAAVNWQIRVWSISAASLASCCLTYEAVKVSPARPVRRSSLSCRSTHSTAYRTKNWSSGYPKRLAFCHCRRDLRCKSGGSGSWCESVQQREAGKLMHLCHVKEGWGLNWEGSLTGAVGRGQMACHSWNDASFHYILFCHVLKKEKRTQELFCCSFGTSWWVEKTSFFFLFFFLSGRMQAIKSCIRLYILWISKSSTLLWTEPVMTVITSFLPWER